MNKEELLKARKEVSWRLSRLNFLRDIGRVSLNKFTKSRQKLIAELHTIDYVLGRIDNLDSDIWFKKLDIR